MNRTLVCLIAAAAVAGSAITGLAVAQDSGSRTERSGPTAHQLAAEADVRTAVMKADLRLTADQEKLWPGFESAMHDLAERRAEREVAFRAARAEQKGPDDVIAFLNRFADVLGERSADMKKLAEAAAPLYASFDERQKKEFSRDLIRVTRDD
jgi:hypothetical protein